jgi:hypothetical protein
MSNEKRSRQKPKPLKITCTSAKCDSDLHCFKKSREMAKSDYGKCRSCGADLVDWDRMHQGKIEDANYVFESLNNTFANHWLVVGWQTE